MRRFPWIILGVLILGIGAPCASADSSTDGTINFAVTSGSPDATGSFVFDNTTNAWTSFLITWNGQALDQSTELNTLSIPLSSLESSSGDWCAEAAIDNGCGNNGFIRQFDLVGFYEFHLTGPVFDDLTAAAAGTYTLTETEVTTPEPGPIVLILPALGLVFLVRKRIGPGLSRAS